MFPNNPKVKRWTRQGVYRPRIPGIVRDFASLEKSGTFNQNRNQLGKLSLGFLSPSERKHATQELLRGLVQLRFLWIVMHTQRQDALPVRSRARRSGHCLAIVRKERRLVEKIARCPWSSMCIFLVPA